MLIYVFIKGIASQPSQAKANFMRMVTLLVEKSHDQKEKNKGIRDNVLK